MYAVAEALTMDADVRTSSAQGYDALAAVLK
jgi:hypothetical protein